MARYQIENTTSGLMLGVYEADTPEAAWKALCDECGADEDRGDDIGITEVAE